MFWYSKTNHIKNRQNPSVDYPFIDKNHNLYLLVSVIWIEYCNLSNSQICLDHENTKEANIILSQPPLPERTFTIQEKMKYDSQRSCLSITSN